MRESIFMTWRGAGVAVIMGILAGAMGLITPPVAAETIAIMNAKLWTGVTSGTQNNMTVLVEDGKIQAILENAKAPDGVEVIDAAQNWVTPGGIAAFSSVGIVEVNAESSSNDTSADGSSFSTALSAADSFNPAAAPVAVTRIEGITRIVVSPSIGARLFGGIGLIANTSGGTDSIEVENAFSYIDMGIAGVAASGGSRAAAWTTLRHALKDAREVGSWPADQLEGYVLNRGDATAFSAAVNGEHPLVISAHRASDLHRLILLKADIPQLDIIIVGATEAWRVAPELAAAGISVIIDPFENLPATFEEIAATSRNAERLLSAGVQTAFAYLDDGGHQARLAWQVAGNAVANGVSHDAALRAVTLAPAKMFKMAGRGVISEGSVADIVIWNGDPLEVTSAPTAILIDGKRQSLESRQTRLRDRYLSLDENELPLAYKRP